MNFDQSIFPLTEFLLEHGFSVTKKEQHYVQYSQESSVITIAYASLEYLFYFHVGENENSLIELTPIVVKELFKDGRFELQSTLTIENLISFLKTSGKLILSGDKEAFKNLNEFSESQATEYTLKMAHLQNIQAADKAWLLKDYPNFIKYIEGSAKEMLAESYIKKYKIALDRMRKHLD